MVPRSVVILKELPFVTSKKACPVKWIVLLFFQSFSLYESADKASTLTVDPPGSWIILLSAIPVSIIIFWLEK